MNVTHSTILTRAALILAAALLALAGCAEVPAGSVLNRPSLNYDLNDEYMWNDGYGLYPDEPYLYWPYIGFGFGWMPDEGGWDNGFIGEGDGMFGGDEEPGQ